MIDDDVMSTKHEAFVERASYSIVQYSTCSTNKKCVLSLSIVKHFSNSLGLRL